MFSLFQLISQSFPLHVLFSWAVHYWYATPFLLERALEMVAVKCWNSRDGNVSVAYSCVCFYFLVWSLTVESWNDKSKLRGPFPYSAQSGEVSTPSSLYMEYGKWVLGRLGLKWCLFLTFPSCLLKPQLLCSSQLCGGYTLCSLTHPFFNPCARNHSYPPLLLAPSDSGVPLSYVIGIIAARLCWSRWNGSLRGWEGCWKEAFEYLGLVTRRQVSHGSHAQKEVTCVLFWLSVWIFKFFKFLCVE